ncbi:MAG: diguanylate cyclase [Proteobacteria bacterium]|jgi:diguanylate cyclase (GGDEF)-like protein|nr:diguanylate cyclase [Desulfocapsa sp.]MBU3943641.1 diguanylate cyclase [Pseudomonadota bacterium]MCG2743056.1 diguanylate cyclase [Desulfobacteraceae bacterium]MBU3982034.1 diguanylate cyclase [Pseudomonadota bacterium]MBU4028693.1 diguanylate cyclase [Pseudomonadota bacterium]
MFSRQSLRYKINLTITLTLVSVTLVFGAALTVYEIQRRTAVIQQIEQSLNDLTSQYNEVLGNEIFSAHILAIQVIMNDIMQRKSILAITAYNEFGELLVSSSESEQDDLQEQVIAALHSAPASALQEWEGQSILTFTSPIVAYGENVGFWRIGYSLATMETQTLQLIIIFVTLIFSLAVLIGLLLNSILVRFVLRPVYRLRNAMQHIQGTDGEMHRDTGKADKHQRLEGMIEAFDELPQDLVHAHAKGDEIGSLACSFQQMLYALKSAYVAMHTDALTGLNNRRKLDEALKNEINRAQRYKNSFSIILLDIDNFKEVNDAYGHLVGDDVLKRLTQVLKSSFRQTDIAGRWGGDEFLILLPLQDRGVAVMFAERLRAAIAGSQFPEVGTVTSSFGVAELVSGDSVEDLINRADAALYRAKEQGRK